MEQSRGKDALAFKINQLEASCAFLRNLFAYGSVNIYEGLKNSVSRQSGIETASSDSTCGLRPYPGLNVSDMCHMLFVRRASDIVLSLVGFPVYLDGQLVLCTEETAADIRRGLFGEGTDNNNDDDNGGRAGGVGSNTAICMSRSRHMRRDYSPDNAVDDVEDDTVVFGLVSEMNDTASPTPTAHPLRQKRAETDQTEPSVLSRLVEFPLADYLKLRARSDYAVSLLTTPVVLVAPVEQTVASKNWHHVAPQFLHHVSTKFTERYGVVWYLVCGSVPQALQHMDGLLWQALGICDSNRDTKESTVAYCAYTIDSLTPRHFDVNFSEYLIANQLNGDERRVLTRSTRSAQEHLVDCLERTIVYLENVHAWVQVVVKCYIELNDIVDKVSAGTQVQTLLEDSTLGQFVRNNLKLFDPVFVHPSACLTLNKCIH